jgi:putative chitinase
MITTENLLSIFPHIGEEKASIFTDPINKTISDFGINNPAMFIAQIGHESGGFKHLEENLNYSAEQLLKVFPKYFKDKDPDNYARQPERIANIVYSSRMGNGDVSSGDGYKFRGRGAIQITGRSNYESFARSVEMSLDDAVEYIMTPEGAIMSAGWFWDANNINSISDNITKTTKKINGGTIGLEDRTSLYEKAQEVIA